MSERDWGKGRGRPQHNSDQRPRGSPYSRRPTGQQDNRARDPRSRDPWYKRAPAPVRDSSRQSLSNEPRREHGRWGNEERTVQSQQSSRDGRGTIGTTATSGADRAVVLDTNYFRISRQPDRLLYQYSVEILPTIEARSLKSGLLFSKIKQHPSLFDGTKLYLMAELDPELTEFTAKSKRDQQEYQIKVKLVGFVLPNTREYLQVCSVVLRKCEKALGLKLIGRNYYDMESMIVLQRDHLRLAPGYITSIRKHQSEVLMCVEISTKVMRTDTVYDLLMDCRRRGGNYKTDFSESIIGRTVITLYNNNTHTITDVDFDQNAMSMFDLKNGTKTSYIDYFRAKYEDIQITDPGQPMLLSSPTEREKRAGMTEFRALVPELCVITGFDDSMRQNFSLMKQVANASGVNPRERVERIRRFVERLDENAECRKICGDWNFEPERNLVRVDGRVFANETIQFQRSVLASNHEAAWSFIGNHMFRNVDLNNWAFIYPNNCSKSATQFLHTLQSAAGGMGFNINRPQCFTTQRDNSVDWVDQLERARSKDPQIIVCVLSSPRKDLYCIIKKRCYMEFARPSQVLVTKTIQSKSAMSVATKVAIQMNTKLGGVPWMIKVPLSGLMVIGFDVCHDTIDKNKKSYGAMVATMGMNIKETDKEQKYFSTISVHDSKTTLSNDLPLNVRKAVFEFRRAYGMLPKNILMYRSGVGDGQFEHVKEHEIKHILRALEPDYGNVKVRLTFIVVTRRINTRFFKSFRAGTENPSAGTVVDNTVVLPDRNNFFLVSQKCKHGTVSPTSYNILYDEMGIPVERLQKLTYKLTHLYYNWCGTLAVPAVCQYAQKLAYMVANYLHGAPGAGLSNTLYFL